jgi:CxxC motif-containing protein
MERKFICIRCPKGCEITTTLDDKGNILKIEGNSCKLGIEHVKAELSDPRRTLTTTVRVEDGIHPVVPVWTEKPVPEGQVMNIVKVLSRSSVKAPVAINQIIIENVLGTGINVITSRAIPERHKEGGHND